MAGGLRGPAAWVARRATTVAAAALAVAALGGDASADPPDAPPDAGPDAADATPAPGQTAASPSASSSGDATAPKPAQTQAATDGITEVQVRGKKRDPGAYGMTGRDVRQMPGAFGDAFRAIEALPGVIPVVSGLPYFLIRGAPPGNTGFFIDGVRVPALFHLGVGAAVVHPGLIDRVDLYPGGYPARFGRFTGGILSGEVLPTPIQPHVEASVRLLDAGALVSAPVDDGRGDILASGRYGYPGPLLSLFAPDTGLAYWDYQTRAQWRPTDRDQFGVFAFGSYDSVSERDANTQKWTEILGIQFHRIDLRWDRRTGSSGRLRVALTLGYDRSSAGDPSSPDTPSFIESESIGLRTEWADHVADTADLRVGADVTLEHYRVLLPFSTTTLGATSQVFAVPDTQSVQTDLESGAYGELAWRPAPSLDVRPGVRVDAFTSRSPASSLPAGTAVAERAVVAVDPRLSLRWDLSRSVAAIAALGVAHQASNIPLPSPGLQFSQLARGLQSANQYSAGAEVKLPAEFTATADVFWHDYTGLADYVESCPRGEATCNFDGRAIGLEVMVRRPLTRRLTGWVSYTLSRAERDAFYGGEWIRRLSEFDRTHVVNLVFAADLGARWRAGTRLMAYSGLPYSTFTGSVGPPDARGPPFVRVDLRLEKQWHALGGNLSLVFEWLNALLAKESFTASCAPTLVNGLPSGECGPNEIGPITFPSIGLEGAW
jgi:hypothetical protein